jgi:D-alanyl-D-alanine carboxypeptidase/D-alanyl-D-alanine-endopeptidase (penicillin-binding protein 4)
MLRTGFLALVLAAATEAQTAPLAKTIGAVLASPEVRHATWSVHVVDLASGRTLFAHRPDSPLTPASNTKLFSTALALLRLGPDHRFETRVLAAAPPDAQGRLAGDLVLAGGGDPTLSNRPLPYRRNAPREGDPLQAFEDLAAQIAAAGVKRVDGDLIGDDTLYPWEPYPDGWTVDDSLFDSGAPVSALTVNDNLVTLVFRPGANPGDRALLTLNPSLEHFTVLNEVRTGASVPLLCERAPGSSVVRVAGAIARPAAETLALDDPALYAARALAAALQRRGIGLSGRVRSRHRSPDQPYAEPAPVTLVRRHSPPLIQTLQVVNKVSQNLHAELALREAARMAQGDASREAALEELDKFRDELKIPKASFRLEDASGLSRKGLLSAAALTRLLAHMAAAPRAEPWLSTLPIGGEDGSLGSRFGGVRDAARIRAKTGSVRHVVALSGYVAGGNKPRAAFAILANHASAPAGEVRQAVDRIAVAILRHVPY